MRIYLAENYGAYEGWKLREVKSVEEALELVKSGQTYGEFKILKELEIKVVDDETL